MNFLKVNGAAIILALLVSCKNEQQTNKIENNFKTTINTIKNNQNNNTTRYVNAKNGLRYRNKPNGEILGKFNNGKRLEITKETNIFETINDNGEQKKGQWVSVTLNNKEVYLFNAFLSKNKQSNITKTEIKKPKLKILLQGEYRDWENKNAVEELNKKWLDLYKKNGNYYLNKSNYTIKKGYSVCSGDSTKRLTSSNKTLIFINNSNLKKGKIVSKKLSKNQIFPNEALEFSYKNIKYKLRAEGDIKSSYESDGKFYADVENYKLYVSINNNDEILLIEEKTFNDTFVKLLFVGDIDSDNVLDFIFEANRHYEEERVILYLSTKEKETIYKSSEISIQFDC